MKFITSFSPIARCAILLSMVVNLNPGTYATCGTLYAIPMMRSGFLTQSSSVQLRKAREAFSNAFTLHSVSQSHVSAAAATYVQLIRARAGVTQTGAVNLFQNVVDTFRALPPSLPPPPPPPAPPPIQAGPTPPEGDNIRAFLQKNSQSDVILFCIRRSIAGAEIVFPDRVHSLDTQELMQIGKGQPLSKDHAFTRAVTAIGARSLLLYSEGSSSVSTAKEDEQFLYAFQKAYPLPSIFRDPFSEKTVQNAQSLRGIKIGDKNEIVTLIAGDSFRTTDWNINGNLLPELAQRGYRNYKVFHEAGVEAWSGPGGKLVLVITGHINENLVSFLKRLGDAGYFKDNFVLLNTCYETMTRGLLETIIRSYGAIGAFSYESKIRPSDVEAFLFELFDTKFPQVTPNVVDHIRSVMHRHNLNGIWTLCLSDRPLSAPRIGLLATHL